MGTIQAISEYYPDEYLRILRQIAKDLKISRLKNEFIYYIADGTFMVISPQITRKMMEKIDLENYQEFPELSKLAKHLHRGLETDIIVEYLKENQDD